MKCRIKVLKYESGKEVFIPQYRSFFIWWDFEEYTFVSFSNLNDAMTYLENRDKNRVASVKFLNLMSMR